MLKNLKMSGVGQMPNMEFNFGKRFNVLTGDNGLGKTFLMDIIWYVLTRHWPREVNPQLMCGFMAQPAAGAKAPSISFDLLKPFQKSAKTYTVKFDGQHQAWRGRPGRPYSSGLVIYAQPDGGFCVWDPAKNYWTKKGNADIQEREPAFVFTANEVWNGQYKYVDGTTKTQCMIRGLLDDWLMWQSNPASREFPVFKELLRRVSPPEYEIGVGNPEKSSLDDVRDTPTIRMPYGDVPIIWASSAIRRIVSVVYVLVWSFSEHQKSARFLRLKPANQVTLLFDELDAHLHPKWQRRVMSALLRSVDEMMQMFADHGAISCDVQIISSTHSPLVMSALEDDFDPNQDKWFDFDFGEDGKTVGVQDRDYKRLGSAEQWLKGYAFDLTSTRSPNVEHLLGEAADVLEKATESRRNELPDGVVAMFRRMRKLLPATDPYLLRFQAICQLKGWRLPHD